MLNREPDYVQFAGKDPLAYVVSQNLCRRHLSESQRAMVAAAIIELHRDDDGRSEITVAQVAKQLNVGGNVLLRLCHVLRYIYRLLLVRQQST